MHKNITSLGSLNWDDLKFFLEVARTRKVSSAARRLAVDYTTVSRRINSLETSLGTLLFEKSRNNGFIMTAEGQRLLGYAESIESTLHMACEQVSGSSVALSGHVRVGCTEGFGSFFITPQLSHFLDSYPAFRWISCRCHTSSACPSARLTLSSPLSARITGRTCAANSATTACACTRPRITSTAIRRFSARQIWPSISSSATSTTWHSARSCFT
ncbi:Fused ISPsy20 transposase IstB/transcriptional regulator LysR protein [Pseudomonas coronafaciens pv. coronafaciens]|nr:Fused ISPsy20 transposase IstB/transcriptional regulator LysR protein [Pseudomonas coronafaciens pv. coronafaciens]